MGKLRVQFEEDLFFGNGVAGFDIQFGGNEASDFLQVYEKYLGPEYDRLKTVYQNAVSVLTQTYELKL